VVFHAWKSGILKELKIWTPFLWARWQTNLHSYNLMLSIHKNFGGGASITGWYHSQKWWNEHGMYKNSTSILSTTDSNNSVSLKACGYADLFLSFSTKNSRMFLLILNSTIIDKPVQVKNIHLVLINPSDLNFNSRPKPAYCSMLIVVCLAFILQAVSFGKPARGAFS
jgi:hypothetical protein